METNRILDVHLLGSFRLSWGDQPVASFAQARLQYLLAYLLLHPRIPISRRQLAFTFWPDTTDDQALTNLRTLLHRLRDALPDSQRFLEIDRHTITWRADAGCVSDVAEYEAALTRAAQGAQPGAIIAALQAAVDAYLDDLLPDCYDEWIIPQRERLRQAFHQALERLIALQEQQRLYPLAIQNAQRLLRLDPLYEAGHRHLMRLHLANGDRVNALRSYHRCATLLRREMGVDPGPEIQALYQHLLAVGEDGSFVEQPMDGKLITIEHFGYADGVSQPLMIKEDIDDEVSKRGNAHWDPAASLNLALIEEQPGSQTYGSYMVFRKLEQNVRLFKDRTEQLADQMGLTGTDRPLAGALAVGRHKDGTPVIPTTVVQPDAFPNDFNYDNDADGKVCPFHAHIRKSNPRGDLSRQPPGASPPPMSLEREKRFRIVRRGITYGDRPDLVGNPPPAQPPETGVGLLFMSFQANLRQFTIQQGGSDSNDFVRPGVGVDAIIGRNDNPTPQTWPGSETPFPIANLVSFKGGEYFFAPSLPFLRGLDANGP